MKASGDISVAANVLTISSRITESGGSRSINKKGTGQLTLSGANTFTGGTILTLGVLEAANNSALGTGATVVNGGTLEVNVPNATLTTSAITVNTTGQIAVRNITLNNGVTLNGGTLATRDGDLGNFAGPVNITAPSFAVLRNYAATSTNLSMTISGLLSGSGMLTINGNASNSTAGKALILTNPGNTYSGTFAVSASQFLRSAPSRNR